MNVLIINLTRFGDLLQMQPLILGLKAQGHNIGLVCLHNFAAATALMRGLDYVAPVHGADFLRQLNDPHPQAWHHALQQAESLFAHIHTHFPVQQIINTTATTSARILARRLAQGLVQRQEHQSCQEQISLEQISQEQDKEPPVEILGFGLDDHGFGVSGDMWATFLQGASAERLNCPFNIVDMFRAVGKCATAPALHGLAKPHATQLSAVHALLQEHSPPKHEGCKGYVAFQLGASEKRRQWAVEHFAAVGAKLWQEQNLCPVLLGSPAEQALGEAYAACMHTEHPCAVPAHPHINLMGKTDITHLAAALCHCKLLITNDTGTMHLAAGLQIPVLSIFLATAQAFDTGPYMPQACCLEPALPCHPCAFHTPCVHQVHAPESPQPCLKSISPDTVGALALQFLQHGTWETEEARETGEGRESKNARTAQGDARIWLTAQDSTSFATLRCISGHEQEERSHWLQVQRYFYRHILDEVLDYEPLPSEIQQHIQGLSLELRQSVSQSLQQCSELLLLLKEQMRMLQRMPSAQGGQRILSTCNTIHGLLGKCPHLKALSYLWLVLFQEHGGALESFTTLILSLRVHFLAWHTALALPEST